MKRTAVDRPRTYAQVAGSPGERARLAGLLRAAWPFLIAAAFSGYLARAAVPAPALSSRAVGLLCLALAAALVVAVKAGRARMEAYLKGARGEERVARELAFLPDAYRVYHSVSLNRRSVMPRGGDFDHVAVGPNGVFVIETKNWNGTVTVQEGRVLFAGREPDRPPVEQVKAAARSLGQALGAACGTPVAVTPVLCFASDTVLGEQQGVAGVVVCNAIRLTGLIREWSEQSLAPAVREAAVGYLDGLVD